MHIYETAKTSKTINRASNISINKSIIPVRLVRMLLIAPSIIWAIIRATALVLSLVLLLAAPSFAADFDKLNARLKERYNDISIVGVQEVHDLVHGTSISAPSFVSGDEQDLILLDARTKAEYQISHIKGAQLGTNLAQALSEIEKSAADKDTPIVVYCALGYRSGNLVRKLEEQGYTNVHNMEGSIFQWVEEGFPVYQDGSEVKQVHAYNSWWGRHLRNDYKVY